MLRLGTLFCIADAKTHELRAQTQAGDQPNPADFTYQARFHLRDHRSDASAEPCSSACTLVSTPQRSAASRRLLARLLHARRSTCWTAPAASKNSMSMSLSWRTAGCKAPQLVSEPSCVCRSIKPFRLARATPASSGATTAPSSSSSCVRSSASSPRTTFCPLQATGACLLPGAASGSQRLPYSCIAAAGCGVITIAVA